MSSATPELRRRFEDYVLAPIPGIVTNVEARLTDDFRESAAAFVEKRKPAFKGR